MVGIISDKFMGWEYDQKSEVRITLKHIVDTTEGKKETWNKLTLDATKTSTKEDRISFAVPSELLWVLGPCFIGK